MKAIVSEKGQVTIPQDIREKLGLRAGVVLNFHIQEGTLIARKEVPKNSLDEVVGILRDKITDVDTYIAESRGAVGPVVQRSSRRKR